MSEPLDALFKRTRANLKRIAASQGDQHGYFYLVYGKSPDLCELAVTLRKLDPKGKKVGKLLFGNVDFYGPGARPAKTQYIQGLVRSSEGDKRLIFEVNDLPGGFKGTMPNARFRPCLRVHYPKRRTGMSFLKQAVIVRGDEEDVPQTVTPAEQSAIDEDLVLTEEDEAILADQEAIAAGIAALRERLDRKGQHRSLAAETLFAEIAVLSKGPGSPALLELRAELAQLLGRGVDPFAAATVPPTELELVKAATDASLRRLHAQLASAVHRVSAIRREAEGAQGDHLAAYAPEGLHRLEAARLDLQRLMHQATALIDGASPPDTLASEGDQALDFGRLYPSGLEDYGIAKALLQPKAPPLQLFCTNLGGRSFVLNEIRPETPVRELVDRVAEAEGLPADAFYLTHGGKRLEANKVVGTYPTLRAGSTVRMQGRLPGGLGEGEVQSYVLGTDLPRGNVNLDVICTQGWSYALTRRVRDLMHTGILEVQARQLAKAAGLVLGPEEWSQWWKENQLQVESTLIQTCMAGNCTEFTTVVTAELAVRANEPQWVYNVVMSGWCDPCPKGRPHVFDHVFALTYPQGDRDDDTMQTLALSDMDPQLATVVDAWNGFQICTLGQLLDGRNHVGHAIDLTVLSRREVAYKAGMKPLPKDLKQLLATHFRDYVEQLRATQQGFVDQQEASEPSPKPTPTAHALLFDRICSVVAAMPREERGALTGEFRWSDFCAFGLGGVAPDQALLCVQESLQHKRGAPPTPTASNILQHLLDWVDDWGLARSLYPFGRSGSVRDQRSLEDVAAQLNHHWAHSGADVFTAAALDLRGKTLVDYAAAHEAHMARCFGIEAVKERLFATLLADHDEYDEHDEHDDLNRLQRALASMQPQQLGILLEAPGAVAKLAESDTVAVRSVFYAFMTRCERDADLVRLAAQLKPRDLRQWCMWDPEGRGRKQPDEPTRVVRSAELASLVAAAIDKTCGAWPDREEAGIQTLFREHEGFLRAVYPRLSPASRAHYRGPSESPLYAFIEADSELSALPVE